MREIKYRQPMFDDDGKFIGFHYWGFIGREFIDPATAWTNGKESQQITNLKDKNGKEIYEGDIVDYDGHLAVVKYIEDNEGGGRFYPVWNDGQDYEWKYRWHRLEIIGNIYKNGDLIK